MNLEEIKTWFLVIMAADVISAALLFGVGKLWDYFKKKPLDFKCDSCNTVKALKATPKKDFYLCKKCMDAYLIEHADEFSEEQLKKARFGYRRRRK